MKHPGIVADVPSSVLVAFTPKGGCPLKRAVTPTRVGVHAASKPSSIHPQGWVPIETNQSTGNSPTLLSAPVAFTPKGGCPLKQPHRV